MIVCCDDDDDDNITEHQTSRSMTIINDSLKTIKKTTNTKYGVFIFDVCHLKGARNTRVN